ncbi:MAG: ABC transporter ATP-binding protein [Clostridiales bacterium]|nr:ABC transporter ATP-binding protein [Clostridiales bacterium]
MKESEKKKPAAASEDKAVKSKAGDDKNKYRQKYDEGETVEESAYFSLEQTKLGKLIEFKDVRKIYKSGEVEIPALSGVDFTIDEGEFVVVLGASGAGKSTILNILGGMDTATSGSVVVDGEDITHYNQKRLTLYRREKVGFVFQFYNLITNLNALENVEFAASVTQNHLDPAETLKAVGLADRAGNFPSQLSGGEQQRVAIARAIAKNPLLLLCDEPTGALDYKTGKMILKLLENVNVKFRKTVVLITHNSAIAPMADKVIHVRSGKVERIDVNTEKVSVETIEW